MEQRVIFDTTIFGILAKEENSGEIQLKIKEDPDFKVFGVNANYVLLEIFYRNQRDCRGRPSGDQSGWVGSKSDPD